MLTAIVKNNIIESIGELNALFPNTSFPTSGVSEEWMQENHVVPITYWKQHDNATQKLSPTDPYVEDGKVYTVIVEAKTEEEIAVYATLAEKAKITPYELAIQSKLDEVAKEKDFNSDIDAASYVNSTTAEWKAEAEKFIAYRDAIWEYYYNARNTLPLVDLEDFIANMPVMVW